MVIAPQRINWSIRRRRVRLLRSCAIAGVVLAILGGCGETSRPAPDPRPDATVRAVVGDRSDPLACLRPPYGAVDARTAPLAAELGKAPALWDVDPQGWRQPSAVQIASYVLSHASPGAIILMHDGGGGRSQTVAALETVLAELSSRGYEFRGILVCGGEAARPDATPTPADDQNTGADAAVTPSG